MAKYEHEHVRDDPSGTGKRTLTALYYFGIASFLSA